MVCFELNDTKSKNSKRSLEPDISHISRGQFGSSQNSSTQRRVHLVLLVGRGNTNLASNEPLPPRIKESSLTKEAKSGGILSVKEMRKETKRKRMEEKSTDDPELEKMLKERLRWGDPMAHLVKRKTSELILEDFAENEKMKESGFMVPQTIPSHSWLKRGLDFPPNRYGIKPGRHWDGVDRSNGYEKELFKRQNEKRATETEAYLWSVSDM